MNFTMGLGIIIFVVGTIVFFMGENTNSRTSYDPNPDYNLIEGDDTWM